MENYLFNMDVRIDMYKSDVLDSPCEVVMIKKDGTVKAGRKVAGRIKPAVWNYINYFCTPKWMRREEYNTWDVVVTGTADTSLVFDPPEGTAYNYYVGKVRKWPRMLPDTEYIVDAVYADGKFDILLGGEKIGTLADEDQDKMERLKRMIDKGFTTTAKIKLKREDCHLWLVVRKV